MSQSVGGPRTIAEMPAQRPSDPVSAAQARGLFFNTGNAFNVQLPAVPDHLFIAEPVAALAPETPTGLIACDLSSQLGCPFPATTPLVLARYGRIRSGESLTTAFAASGIICYVIAGAGTTDAGTDRVVWNAGDLFVLPGGPTYLHAASADAVLWLVTNEPQLAFEHLRPPAEGEAPTAVVHFTAAEIARQIDKLYEVGRNEKIAGSALVFSSEGQAASRNILPTLTLAMNSLPGGESQPPHVHNAVAVSLIIKGRQCYSVMNGKRKDWAPWATTITPPTAVHSHHNGGNEQAMFLIVQDGGIFYHARAMGFAFAEHPEPKT
ncbi:MAG TPA: cupin domain-containing protein [Rhodopila sp.]